MKHLITLFLIVLILSIVTVNHIQASSNNNQLIDMQNVDCWSFAIEWMEDIEKNTGLFYTTEQATIFLNDTYAACFCIHNITHWLQWDACYGDWIPGE